MVAEDLDHVRLTSCFKACDKVKHHGKAPGNKERKEEAGDLISCIKLCPFCVTFSGKLGNIISSIQNEHQ